ncbi:MAG: hypothetical protein EPO26_17075 [Chloroflexota bacterium]|nr:MAG: hypothetical protein EPO26_17075 [Chloroflexota bacterium]
MIDRRRDTTVARGSVPGPPPETAGVSPALAVVSHESPLALPGELSPTRPGTAAISPALAIVSRESLLALAVVAALVEFLALRVVTRVGEFLPGDGWNGPLFATMYLGLAALNVAAIAAALAALVVAWSLISGAMPARALGATIVTAVGLNVVASLPGADVPVWLRAAATLAALLSMAIAIRPNVLAGVPGLAKGVWARAFAINATEPARPTIALFAGAPIRLAIAATGLALIPGLVAETGNTASAGLVHAVIEALAVGAALAAPLALSRRPGRGAIVAGFVAAALLLAIILGRPTTASSFAMWSFSFALWLPAPVYALAAGTLVVSLVDGLRRAETRRLALALALVALAGIRPEATYPALLALAAGTALVQPWRRFLATPVQALSGDGHARHIGPGIRRAQPTDQGMH